MPTLTVETVRADRATFVEVLLEAERPHRVRIERCFDGQIWPPRRDGRVVDGWDERGVTATVEAGTTPFGFATPAEPTGTAAELVAVEPLEDELPEGIAAWFHRVEERLETAERLAAVDDLPSATAAVASVDGLAGVESLAAEVARDRRLLSRLSVAPDELQRRAEAVEIPTQALARVAQSDSCRS